MTSGDFEPGDVVICQGERFKVFCSMNGWVTILPAIVDPMSVRDVMCCCSTVRAKDIEKEGEHAL